MSRLVAALDQGTTSTRAMLFDRAGRVVSRDQQEHAQSFPRPGWVEHDPREIWARSLAVLANALAAADLDASALAAIGVANQRETTVVWNRYTGEPYAPAIVWNDTRTADLCRRIAGDEGADRFRPQTGLPVATYFSGPKLRWLLDHAPGLRAAADAGDAIFGTIDTWLIWNLTGGPSGGLHVTDVTNASRTLLFNIHTLDWDDAILRALDIPRAMLPRVAPSVGYLAEASTGAPGAPIAGVFGDQQAALFGQTCFAPGEAKNTYGTGCFLLLNTGTAPIASASGLLTTVGYQIGDAPPVYCLEGAIATTGSLIQWLRDNLGLIDSAAAVEALAASVPDSGGMYIAPAFSGLFAPYWRSDA
ncbi:MAG: glycerol kinase GlpK, partial [Dehalococcoidia bacterium]|nr:glycerol kinase GlpK [Dehalococcoidia bacterium]